MDGRRLSQKSSSPGQGAAWVGAGLNRVGLRLTGKLHLHPLDAQTCESKWTQAEQRSWGILESAVLARATSRSIRQLF